MQSRRPFSREEDIVASTITVRNLDEATQLVLRHRAVDNGRSFEAEIREILTEAARTSHSASLFEAAEECRDALAGTDTDLIQTFVAALSENRDEQQREVFA